MTGSTTNDPDAPDGQESTFVCPQCDSKFSRLAHLRRHEMTHRGEKPYNCLYCPVASTRKDVIVRHTRNFHPGAPRSKNRTGPSACGQRGKRRRTSSEGTSRGEPSPAAERRFSWASSTAIPMGSSQEPEAGNKESEETPESSATSSNLGHCDLRTFMPAEMDLINFSFLGDGPLDFTGSFMGQDLDYGSISEGIDMDLLMSNPDDFLTGNPINGAKLPARVSDSMRTRLPGLRAGLSPSGREERRNEDEGGREIRVHLDDANNDCAKALANFAKYPAEIIAPLRLPSKHATRRFVSAFFRHIVSHIPILHEPTFDIATVPSPLLLAMMACGATYVSEQATGASLHAAAVQLILEHEKMSAACTMDDSAPIWILQTYLLLSYYEVHCGTEGRAAHTFPNAVIRAQEALGQLKPEPVTTYEGWVSQESINRCLACAIVLGASIGSKERELFIASPVTEARFALPSSNKAWQAAESEWEPPKRILYSDEALKDVLAGRQPKQPVSEFGLVTLVSTVLYRICAFEALTSPDMADLYASFGERLGRSVHALDDMVQRRMGDPAWGVPPEPIMQSAKSLLNSAFYHLYASIPLAGMKKMLWSTTALGKNPHVIPAPPGSASPGLYKALIRAADQLRFDCRLGPKHLRAVAPLKYGPESAIGPYEGGLLLFWYLEFAHSRLPQADESCDTLNALIDEGLLEVEDLRLQMQDWPQSLPLAVTAELLSESTVWKWPSTVSEKMTYLIDSFKTRCNQ